MTFTSTATALYSYDFEFPPKITNFTILEKSSNDGDSAVSYYIMNCYKTKNN